MSAYKEYLVPAFVLSIVVALALVVFWTSDQQSTDPQSTPIVTETRPVAPAQPVAPSRSSVSQECEQFEAAAGVNERLAADGYADDYSAEWDDLLKASGCR